MAQQPLTARTGTALLLLILTILTASLVSGETLESEQPLRLGDIATVAGVGPAGLSVMAAPDPTMPELAIAPEGADVILVSDPYWREGNHIPWFRVTGYAEPDKSGWVEAVYLRAKSQPAAAPEPPAPTPEPVRTVSSRGAAQSTNSFIATVTGYAITGRTASGRYTTWGLVAVDPSVIPLGTRLQIEGFDEVFLAADTGGGVRGRWVDIWFPSYNEAYRFGLQSRRVTILAP